ncbi:MAG: MtnX-like HAD-IB family phosphatase [Chloroflexota bacterium]
MSVPRYVVVTDFDGTAAERDVQQVILDALADPDGWRAINRNWVLGRMTTAERARAQWELIQGGQREVLRVLDSLCLDPGFASFARLCEARDFPLYIVSDGFDFYIQPLLERAGLSHLPVIANSLRYEDDMPRMEFLLQRSPDQYYGNDKTFVIEQVRRPGSTLVFVGDGFSDRAAAHEADLLFAKDKLAEYCIESNLPFEPFRTFDDISTYLQRP